MVGLLICQSSLNEGEGPVLYLAPDPFLASQAMEQAVELGVEVTDDPRSTRFTSGEAICVLSLHRFVNGKSVFGLQGDGRPVVDVGTIVVDDAHAALATVREKFTLTLSRASHEKPFDELLDLFADDLRQQSEITYQGLTTQDSSAVAPVPFWAWTRRIAEVTAVLMALSSSSGLWSTFCGRVRSVIVDLRWMPCNVARKSPAVSGGWPRVLRRERSTDNARRSAARIGAGHPRGVGRGGGGRCPGGGPVDDGRGVLPKLWTVVSASARVVPAVSS